MIWSALFSDGIVLVLCVGFTSVVCILSFPSVLKDPINRKKKGQTTIPWQIAIIFQVISRFLSKEYHHITHHIDQEANIVAHWLSN